jgi:hypothetical protein
MAGESPEVHFDNAYWAAVSQGDPTPEPELATVINLQERAARVAARLDQLRNNLGGGLPQTSDDLRNAA